MDCIDCALGQYCLSEGLTQPTGPCEPGFYCLRGNVEPTPTGRNSYHALFFPCQNNDSKNCELCTFFRIEVIPVIRSSLFALFSQVITLLMVDLVQYLITAH